MIVRAALRETAFDPVFGAQPMLRRLREAAARPGLVVPLGDVPVLVPPARLRPASVLLLASMDREATFAVVGPDAEMLREYLRFNTGAHATTVGRADFVLVTASGRDWSAAKRATLDRPRETATVVLVPSHLGGGATPDEVILRLRGPGLLDEARLTLGGLGILDVALLVDHGGSALGVDVWFAGADGHLAVVPRSTHCRIGCRSASDARPTRGGTFTPA